MISSRTKPASLDQTLWQALAKILLISGTLLWKTKSSSKIRYGTFLPNETVLLSNEKISHAATGPFLFYAFNHSQLFRSRVTNTGISDVLHLVVAVTRRAVLHNRLEERYVLGIIPRSKMFPFLLGC